MEKGTKILIIGTMILVFVLLIFAYLTNIIPQFVIKVDEKDFDVLKIEYTGIYNYSNNETVGTVKLFLKTNRDDLIVGASSKTNKAKPGGCSAQFSKSGLNSLGICWGDPATDFLVSPINEEHNFTVCASAPWSLFYKTEPACKWIILPPYQK